MKTASKLGEWKKVHYNPPVSEKENQVTGLCAPYVKIREADRQTKAERDREMCGSHSLGDMTSSYFVVFH